MTPEKKNNEDKVLCFEYVVSRLISWHHDVSGSTTSYLYSFSRLKILKLLFFVSAVKAGPNDEGLLDVFDNFVAMPLGPVESDIYNAILENSTSVYDFPEREMRTRENLYDFSCLKIELKQRVDDSIELLRSKNENLVVCKPFELVDISHKWSCWDITYEIANMLGFKSLSMSCESIQNSTKYYF